MMSCEARGHHVYDAMRNGQCVNCPDIGSQCGHPDCMSNGAYHDKNHIHFQSTFGTKLMEDSMKQEQAKFNKSPLEDEIRGECNDHADFLVDKNRKYGNSALEPVRIFSQSDVLEQLRVRIDDKLSRIQSAQLDDDEDVINDLIGYFILYRIAKKSA